MRCRRKKGEGNEISFISFLLDEGRENIIPLSKHGTIDFSVGVKKKAPGIKERMI